MVMVVVVVISWQAQEEEGGGVFRQKCMPAIHWAISHLILAELLEIVFLVAYSSKITRSKEKKNETLMSRVPVVDAPRLHVRGDKLIVEFQLAGMFSCDGLRDVIYILEV
ncbi:hypothetical protein Tco_0257362 [Tanacetum coccineum]